MVIFTLQLALNHSGTYSHKTGTRPPTCKLLENRLYISTDVWHGLDPDSNPAQDIYTHYYWKIKQRKVKFCMAKETHSETPNANDQ